MLSVTAATFLGFGTLFTLLWSGIYVWDRYRLTWIIVDHIIFYLFFHPWVYLSAIWLLIMRFYFQFACDFDEFGLQYYSVDLNELAGFQVVDCNFACWILSYWIKFHDFFQDLTWLSSDDLTLSNYIKNEMNSTIAFTTSSGTDKLTKRYNLGLKVYMYTFNPRFTTLIHSIRI